MNVDEGFSVDLMCYGMADLNPLLFSSRYARGDEKSPRVYTVASLSMPFMPRNLQHLSIAQVRGVGRLVV